MNTYLVYFDETGDDGSTIASSDHFVLSSLYMSAEKWQNNYDKMKRCRKELKDQYNFRIREEMHTKHFITDKNPYRNYHWDIDTKQEILRKYTLAICSLDMKIVNVIIDKTRFRNMNYPVLENALKYNIQRIENDSDGKWNYIIITDKGRIIPMRRIAREIRAYNPISFKYNMGKVDQPISYYSGY